MAYKLKPYRQLKRLLKDHDKDRQQKVTDLVSELLKMNIDSEFIGCITHALAIVNSDSIKKANEFAVFIQKQAFSRIWIEENRTK